MIETLRKFLAQFAIGSVIYGGRILVGFLFFLSLFYQTTVYLTRFEWAEIMTIRIWVPVVLLVLLLFFYVSRKWFSKISNKRLFIIGSVFYLIAGLALIFLTTDKTRDDAATVFRAAVELNGGKMQFLDPGAYLYRYPHQLGLVSFERLVLIIIPIPSMVIFFLLNLLMILGINYVNWKITDRLFKNERISRYTIVLLFAFLPQFFNLLFAYGLIYGLFFASFGLYYLICYYQTNQKKKAILAIICLALAAWVRNNYIILLLAVLAVSFLLYVKEKNWRLLLSSLFAIGLVTVMNKATIYHYERISGQSLEGTPKVAWLAMGLQDQPNPARQPGWYNHYVRKIYFEKNGDYQAVEEDAKQVIQKRVQEFLDHPDVAYSFFKTKVITTWTESTFESIWSGPSRPNKQPLENRWVKSLYHGGLAYRIYYQYSHAILLIIYAGAFLFILFRKTKEVQPLELYAFIYLAGGVVFHLLWETKSQYVYPYVFLLTPFAVTGYFHGFHKVQKQRQLRKSMGED